MVMSVRSKMIYDAPAPVKLHSTFPELISPSLKWQLSVKPLPLPPPCTALFPSLPLVLDDVSDGAILLVVEVGGGGGGPLSAGGVVVVGPGGGADVDEVSSPPPPVVKWQSKCGSLSG